MAGSQTAFDVEQEVAQLAAEHAASCGPSACIRKDASFDVALDLIAFPVAIALAALLLQRAGFWDGVMRRLSGRLKRHWLAQAGFGAVLASVFVAASLPFGLYDALTADPAAQSGFRCVDGEIKCPFPELTRSDMVWNFMENWLWHALKLTAIFAALAPLAFALRHRRPRLLLTLAAGAYLAWQFIPLDSKWEQTYPMPEGPLNEDVSRIAARAGITMDRVLIGQPKPLRGDGGGEANWHGAGVKAVVSERLLNIHAISPHAIHPQPVPFSAGEFRFLAAHEIAHVRHHHVEWLTLASVIVTGLGAALAAAVAANVSSRSAADRRDLDAGFLAVFLAVGLTLHYVHTPIRINLQRAFENQADATAHKLALGPDGALDYIRKDARGAPLVLDRWYHALYRTHPDNMTRIRRAVEWKAANPAGHWSASGETGPMRWRWKNRIKLVTDEPGAIKRAGPDTMPAPLTQMPRPEGVR